MKAIIWAFAPDPKNPTPVANIHMENGRVIIETENSNLEDSLETSGIIGRGGKAFFPIDGMNFIQELPYHFKSGYLRAEVLP